MGFMAKYIQQAPTGRLSYRRAYPSDLRPFIPRQPREFKRSLRGVDLSQPSVSRLYSEAQAEYKRLVGIAKRERDNIIRPLLDTDIVSLVETYAYRLQKNMADSHYDTNDTNRHWYMASAYRYMPIGLWDELTAIARGEELPSTFAKRLRVLLPDLIATWQTLIADGDRLEIISLEGESAADLLEEYGLEVEHSSDLHFALCLALLRKDQQIVDALQKQVTEGVMIEATPPTVTQSLPQVPSQPEVSETLDELAERLMDSQVSPVGLSTQQSWRTALRFWTEANSKCPHSTITRLKVSAWLEMLAQRPVKLPKKDRRLALPALIEKYRGHDDVPRLSGKTINQHLSSLSTIWSKSQRVGRIADLPNPFANHDVRIASTSGGNPLTVEEVNAVLSLPIFTQGERPRSGRGEASYWIPLFLIFTGARPNEVAQLVVSDFWNSSDQDGQLMMRYTDEGDHPAGGPRRLKTTEKGTGRREFPVPKALLDLGLVDYMAWLEQQGQEALFPMLIGCIRVEKWCII